MMRSGELARRLKARISGNPDIEIKAIKRLELAGPSDLSFFSGGRYVRALAETRAGALLVPEDLTVSPPQVKTLLFVEDVSAAVEMAAKILLPQTPQFQPSVRHPTAVIHPEASVHQTAYVGPKSVVCDGASVGARTVLVANVYVGPDAKIGDDCLIWPGVVVRERCLIGDRVVIHPNAVIGSDGFGFRTEGGKHKKLPQYGIVVVEDDVEIGACCTIDRARFDETRIGAGTKIDNLVHIAHNVRIGKNCLIVAQAGIAGSATIGDGAVLAGQSGVDGHVIVGDGVVVAGKAGVTKDIPPGKVVAGYPAQERWRENRCRAVFRRLPEILSRLKPLLGEQKDET